jgi:hypothetical protein
MRNSINSLRDGISASWTDKHGMNTCNDEGERVPKTWPELDKRQQAVVSGAWRPLLMPGNDHTFFSNEMRRMSEQAPQLPLTSRCLTRLCQPALLTMHLLRELRPRRPSVEMGAALNFCIPLTRASCGPSNHHKDNSLLDGGEDATVPTHPTLSYTKQTKETYVIHPECLHNK